MNKGSSASAKSRLQIAPFAASGMEAWLIGALFVGAYVVVAIGGLEFALLSPQVTPVWLPTSLALALLLLFGRHLWPAVFVAATIVNIRQIGWPEDPGMLKVAGLLGSALVVGGGNAAEAVIAEWICRRVGMRLSLDRVRDAAVLLLIASPVAPIISAVAGAGSLAVSGRIPGAAFWDVLQVWYVGNLIGFLVGTPLLICWVGRPWRRGGKVHAAEWVVLIAALVVAIGLTFYKPSEDTQRLSLSLAFVPLAVLAVGAIRLGPRGSAVMVGVLAFGSAAGTIAKMGPFGMESVHDSLIVLWVYLGVSAVMAGFLASMSAEREAAAMALRESERRLRQLADHVDAVYWVLDVPSGRVAFVSDAFERVFGRGAADPRDRSTWLAQVHPDDRAKVGPINAATPLPQDLTYRVAGDDGSVRWIHERLFPLEQQAAANIRVGGVASDITVLVEAEEQRRAMEARDEQSKKLESLGVIAGGVAHDFNNLLVAVIGNARMIINRGGEPATTEAAHKIVQTAQHAADLTRQLMTTAGRGTLRPEKTDLGALVREYTPLVVSGDDLARIVIEVIGDKPVVTMIDPTQARQVVLNLVTNAIEASTDPSSPICIRVGACRLDSASLETCVPATRAAPGDFVFIEVADRGCGMSEETQRRMFDPFYSTKFAGRGLGMASVLGIVASHHGAIHLASAPDVGTSIRVLFPLDLRAGAASVDAEPPQAAETEASPGTVLVVDDEPLVRDLAVQALRLAGLEVISARDGSAAIDLIDANGDSLGVVLLDLTMPGLSGADTLREIRARRPKLPVVITTGAPDRELIDSLTSDPRVRFIAKPYSIEELVDCIRRELRRKSPAAAT